MWEKWHFVSPLSYKCWRVVRVTNKEMRASLPRCLAAFILLPQHRASPFPTHSRIPLQLVLPVSAPPPLPRSLLPSLIHLTIWSSLHIRRSLFWNLALAHIVVLKGWLSPALLSSFLPYNSFFLETYSGFTLACGVCRRRKELEPLWGIEGVLLKGWCSWHSHANRLAMFSSCLSEETCSARNGRKTKHLPPREIVFCYMLL